MNLSFLDGNKVYLTGLAAVVYGVYQFWHGDVPAATQSILMGLGLIFGRHTLQKIEQKVTPTNG